MLSDDIATNTNEDILRTLSGEFFTLSQLYPNLLLNKRSQQVNTTFGENNREDGAIRQKKLLRNDWSTAAEESMIWLLHSRQGKDN